MMVNMMGTLLLLMAVGYIARKTGFIDDTSSKWLSNFVICVCQPFMIINAVISVEFSTENLKTAGIVMAVGIAVHAVSAIVSHIATLKYKNIDERAIVEYGIIFGNCGFMGFPVIKAMLGDTALFWAAFYVIDFNIICWTYGMIVLSRARKEIRINVKNMFLNYGTTPCLIGLVLWLSRLTLPQPVVSTVKYIGDVCTPLSMIIVGIQLANSDFRGVFRNKDLLLTSGINIIGMPLLTFLLVNWLPLAPEVKTTLIFAAAFPCAVASVGIISKEGRNASLAAEGVAVTTALSLITLPIIATLLSSYYGL